MAGAVAVLVVAAIVTGVVVLTGDSGGSDSSEPIDDWDVVVVVASSGEISVLDRSGSPVDDASGLDVGFRPATVIPGPASLVVGGSRGASFVDLDAWRVDELAIDDDAELAPVATSPATVVAAPPRGGDVVLVDQASGAVTDVGEFAGLAEPLLLPTSVRAGDGRFLVADAQNFQTLMVGGGLDQPVYFPGRPLAIGADVVVTGQPVGERVDIGLFDLDGGRLASVTTERLVGGTTDAASFVFVTADGSIARIARDDDDAEALGRIDVPASTEITSAVGALSGTRLVVGNDRFTSVVDTAGVELARFDGEGFDSPVIATSTQRCVVIGPRSSPTGDLHVVDLESGEDVGSVAGGSEPVSTPDGCTMAVAGPNGYVVIGRDVEEQIDGVASVDAVAPDAKWVAVTTTAGRRELRPLGEQDDDPFEVPADGTVVFVDRS